MRGQMNDCVHARKRVQQISPDWEQARVVGGEAGHVPVDRMNRGDVGRDRLRPILPFAPVIAMRSAALSFIISPCLATCCSHAIAALLDLVNIRSLTMIRCAEAAAFAALASPTRIAERIAA